MESGRLGVGVGRVSSLEVGVRGICRASLVVVVGSGRLGVGVGRVCGQVVGEMGTCRAS